MFNVTVLIHAGDGAKKLAPKVGEHLHLIEFETPVVFNDSYNPENLKAHENKLIDHLVYKKNMSKVEEIGRTKYDVAYSSFTPYEMINIMKQPLYEFV